MQSPSWKSWVRGLVGVLLLPAGAQAQLAIEYVAHACFVVESPTGVRVVLDPYSGQRWLGYEFPEGVSADAVLISHPHYDHDASYYWATDVPVFRRPGHYAVGDVQIEGIEGRHADPYGREFAQLNTIWVLEVGGLRIVHLGDNGPLSEANLQQLGRVDVLMIPIDATYHILQQAEIDTIRTALRPRITLPMHYRIERLSELPEDLGPLEPWLAERRGVTRLQLNRAILTPESLPPTDEILVLPPSPAVKPWGPAFQQAQAEWRAAEAQLKSGSRASEPGAVERLRRATELAPEAVLFWGELAEALSAAGQRAEAVAVLERGLAGAGQADWEHTLEARAQLAELYRATGQPALAAQQYRLILAGSYRLALLERARKFFAQPGARN